MTGIQHIDFIHVEAQLWVPPKLTDHRLIMTFEARHRARLMALTSHCARPGPFDELADVHAEIGTQLADFLNVFEAESRPENERG